LACRGGQIGLGDVLDLRLCLRCRRVDGDQRLDHVVPGGADRNRVGFHSDAMNVNCFLGPAGRRQVGVHCVFGHPGVVGLKVLDIELPVIGIDQELHRSIIIGHGGRL